VGIFETVFQGIGHNPRAFNDEIRIQLLAVEKSSCKQVTPVRVALCDPCA
jgi:hypothetical protein